MKKLLGRHCEIRCVAGVQATIDIDAELLQEAEQLARRQGQPLSIVVEQALRHSLHPEAPAQLYGEPLTDEDIADSARVTFSMLDGEEKSA